ncbi:hypothetical protein D3C72_1808420 [compost metagenome]
MRRNSFAAPHDQSGIQDIVEVKFFADLLNPFVYAFCGEFWLTVFVNRQAHKMIVIRKAFRRFKVITRRWPMTDNRRAARFDDVANGAQRITEVLCVIFLVTATEQRDQLTVKVDFFQRWEEIVPVTLCFAVVPGWNAQQQNIVTFEIFFTALRNVMDVGNVFT